MKYTNRVLFEAIGALGRMGEAALPRTFPTQLKFRLALNRNYLRPVADEIEKQRKELVERHQVGPEHSNDAVERPARVVLFQKEWDTLMAEEVEWASCATIDAKRFPDDTDGVLFNDLAALVAAGIITDVDAMPQESGKK
jgi:hypothetical protein